MKKSVIVTHFTTKIIRTYLYLTCNKKILFVKKYLCLLWVFTDFSTLLFALWTYNTAITRQLIRTARTLEAEWWQVCGEAWLRVQRKMSHVLGAFGLLGFTTLRPVLAWRVFLNLWNVYFFNFPNFVRAAVNRGYLKRGPPVTSKTIAISKQLWHDGW
jgi:hypothetical protein